MEESTLCVSFYNLTTPLPAAELSRSCQRWHPLVCINQALLLELKHIREYNRLEGEERRSATYGKAMAAIKAYPYPLRSVKEAVSILGVGTKIAAQCGEYIKYGKIEAAGALSSGSLGTRLCYMHRGNQAERSSSNTARVQQDPRCRSIDRARLV